MSKYAINECYQSKENKWSILLTAALNSLGNRCILSLLICAILNLLRDGLVFNIFYYQLSFLWICPLRSWGIFFCANLHILFFPSLLSELFFSFFIVLHHLDYTSMLIHIWQFNACISLMRWFLAIHCIF